MWAVVAVFAILVVAVVAGTYYTEPRDDNDPFSEEFYRREQ